MRRWMFDFLLLPLLACGLAFGAYQLVQPKSRPAVEPSGDVVPKSSLTQDKSHYGEPVALNLSPDITAGFRGDVHPRLHGRTRLEVTAHSVAGDGPDGKKTWWNDNQFNMELKPAKQKQIYTERDFSALLPEKLTSVGQIWHLDSTKVEQILGQLHHSPSMHIAALGRRVGPDGALGILRAMSSSHLDIAFRVHAEFDVLSDIPKELLVNNPVEQTWYTPAYFIGEMIVNRESGMVEYFRLGIPTDITLNVHLTLKARGDPKESHFMAHVNRLELLGGNKNLAAKESASGESITSAEAYNALTRVFYKFMDIQWLPYDQILTAARERNKPILVTILWGGLDDQSC